MFEKEFPILEFDEDRDAFIRPGNIIQPVDITERCVLCFFSEAMEKVLDEHPHRIVSYFISESLKLPVYEFEYKGKKVALIQATVGAPFQ